MCHLYSAGLPPKSLVELHFQDRLCIDIRIVQQPIMPGTDGGAHPGHLRVHSNPHCVACRLPFCSANLHMFQQNPAGSPHRRRILMVGDCVVRLPHKLGIADDGCGHAILNHSWEPNCLNGISNLRGREWILSGKQKMHLKPAKCLATPHNPIRQVHALLARS